MNIKLLLMKAFLIVSFVASSCTVSITPTAVPTKINTLTVPESPPHTSAPPTPNLPSHTQSPHQIYAGFTGDATISILLLHSGGEVLGLMVDAQTSRMSGVIWTSSNTDPIVIYTDDRQKPRRAVVGTDVILYSNYTDSTVDVTIVHLGGNRESFRSKLSSFVQHGIAPPFSSSYFPTAFSTTKSTKHQQQNLWGYIDEGLFALEIAACVGVGASYSISVSALLALDEVCHGSLLELTIREGKAEKMDIGDLEAIPDNLERYGCYAGNIMNCVNQYVGDMAEAERAANQMVSNSSVEVVPPKRKKTYP